MQGNEWYSIHTFVGISHAGLFVLPEAIMATRVSALIAVSEPTNQRWCLRGLQHNASASRHKVTNWAKLT